MSDKYYVEVSKTNRHGIPVKLYQMDTIGSLDGFRSVYAYPIETANWVKNNYNDKFQVSGSVAGLTRTMLPVYSDTLFMDFDDDPASAEKYSRYFHAAGVGHEIWTSGGRSYHLHVGLEPSKPSPIIPESHKLFVLNVGDAIGAKADTSIYHAAALFRLPGTVHEKTGKRKELMQIVPGEKLHIDPSNVELRPREEFNRENYNPIDTLFRLLLTQIEAGTGRRMHVYKIASACEQAEVCAEKYIRTWNYLQPDNCRLTEDELVDKMQKEIRR